MRQYYPGIKINICILENNLQCNVYNILLNEKQGNIYVCLKDSNYVSELLERSEVK